ncbi:protein FAM83D isoform X2 [Gadus macrocephalus]|uniref:protein FAM83D isoform X2 n=1 Tax=Gadus macrocephalus TaxID=80720 RepID=UPI0028CBB0B4|nr:protein FAM83D isoform X2 [Gadus macrocephalus]
MSNSHQQSLDEEAVFLPVTEACPEFLHCESERLAVERLMSVGPAAFYACLGAENLGGFLSQEEVNHISGWAHDYTVSRTQAVPEARGGEGGEEEGNGEDGGSSAARCLSSCYFPTHSDAPAPCLDLGWPERSIWPGRDCVKVLTNPPEEGQPSIREIVRRHLQQASQVIAIATDRLTDNVVIGDLHSAASRGVPVYIILNQRSTQEDCTPSMLRHPNMQVRVLGGKTFCSREGRMVVGQMKDNYILVDLETVIHGSYSLTWTDAHLHRHLVTLLSGPVVGSFDREFRILFAASLPVPEVRAAPLTVGDTTHYRMNESSDLWYPNRPLLGPLLSPPPPPPEGTPLDWEALGVFRRKSYPHDSPTDPSVEARERPTQNFAPFEKQPPVEDVFSRNITKRLDTRTQFSMTDSGFNSTTAEIPQRIGPKIEQVYNRNLVQDSQDVEDRKLFTNVERRKETTLKHEILKYSTNQRRDHTRTREALHEDGHVDADEMSFRAEKQPSSRKPLILRVPQNDNYSSLSDIMRRLQPQPSTSAQQKRGSKMAMSELSRSMMDLSAEPTQERGTAVPRLHANFFDPGRMTPAIALMKKRNDEVKVGLYRTPIYQPTARPRSSTFGMQTDWRRPGDRDAEMKN